MEERASMIPENDFGQNSKEKERKIKKLRDELEIGEKSGIVDNFDPLKHLQSLRESDKAINK